MPSLARFVGNIWISRFLRELNHFVCVEKSHGLFYSTETDSVVGFFASHSPHEIGLILRLTFSMML